MSNPTTPVKHTGDTLSAVELNDIVDSVKTKQDANSSTANGIISGLDLSASGLNVTVAAGSWRIAAVIYTTNATTHITLQPEDPDNNRIDLIYGDDSDTISVVTGQVAVNPVKPNLPANSIEIGFVWVTPTGTTGTGAPPADYVTQAQFLSDFGDKTQLITDNKNTSVEAINEVKTQVQQIDQDNIILKIFKKTNYS